MGTYTTGIMRVVGAKGAWMHSAVMKEDAGMC